MPTEKPQPTEKPAASLPPVFRLPCTDPDHHMIVRKYLGMLRSRRRVAVMRNHALGPIDETIAEVQAYFESAVRFTDGHSE